MVGPAASLQFIGAAIERHLRRNSGRRIEFATLSIASLACQSHQVCVKVRQSAIVHQSENQFDIRRKGSRSGIRSWFAKGFGLESLAYHFSIRFQFVAHQRHSQPERARRAKYKMRTLASPESTHTIGASKCNNDNLVPNHSFSAGS